MNMKRARSLKDSKPPSVEKRRKKDETTSHESDVELSDESVYSDDDVSEEDLSEDEGNLPPEGATEWSDHAHSMKTIHFIKSQKLLVPPPTDPLEAFQLIVNDELLDLIVKETNAKAHDLLAGRVTKHSRISRWKDLTREELLIFLGLLLHTGTISVNRLSDYWKKHWLFNLVCFSQYMSRNRFALILRCLSFTSDLQEKNQLSKARPIIDYFNQKMNNIYYPDKNLTVDEPATVYGSNLSCKSHLNNTTRGVITYVLAESGGIVLKFYVPNKDDVVERKDRLEKIILCLLEEKLDSGHSVYMKDSCNSYNMAAKLLERNTYCTGIIDSFRKGNPPELGTLKLASDINKSFFSNGVHIGKWKAKRGYELYITTEFTDEMVEVLKQHGGIRFKPLALVNYHNVKSEMDLQLDQMLTYYPSQRKTMHWYKKLFINILQASLCNAWHIYNKFYLGNNTNMNLYDFRMEILEKLLCNPQKMEVRKGLKIPHVLTKIENYKIREKACRNGEKQTCREVIRKECRGCRRAGQRTGTMYECKLCEGSPGFCIQCFCKTHS